MISLHLRSWIVLLALPIVVSSLCGCGGSHAAVSGKVVEDGKSYQHTGENINIVMAGPSHTLSATVQKDGSFKFYGTENKGLKPGKYKIGISSDVEGAPGVKKRVKDVEPEKSNMEVELAGGESISLTIDLVKQTASK